jgi:hypothetical protein
VSDISEEEKALYKAATERRAKAGIRLKRFCVMADENQVVSLNALWDGAVERWGKQKAVDTWIVILSKVDARLRDKERNAERIQT